MPRATLNRRVAALCIDWFTSLFAAAFVVGAWLEPGLNSLTLVVFGVEVFVFTLTLGGSFGQILLGVRIERMGGGRPGVAAVAVRTLLVCLVLPAVFTGPDGRGFHDRLAGTEPVRFR